jgi:hypothetical protein
MTYDDDEEEEEEFDDYDELEEAFFDEEKAYDQDRAPLVAIPTFEYYQKMYARNMDNEDRKAVTLFKQYESHEKLRRLQAELMNIKSSQIRESTLDRLVGKTRKGRWVSYEKWAGLMLLWINSAKI